MRKKSEEIFQTIREYINVYFMETGHSPSTRDIEAGTGIHRIKVQRYLQSMKESGEIEYGGRRGTRNAFAKTIGESVMVPCYGTVKCGMPNDPFVDITETVRLPRSWVGEGEFYILEADGESMKEIGIDPGDLVVIRRQDTAQPGEVIVAMVDGETTLKRFLPGEDRIVLHPENREFEDIVIEGERILRFVIQGVAVRIVKGVR
ncbi:MAG: repressor LexA [Clostridia bacterium]|nr:repressor LexA [Clostridia bacterium]MCR4904579.1 transcriptional repressor LexA [Clostridiales bacterium]